MADTQLIEIETLTKRFEDHVVLDNVSLDVERGENLVVFGRSGEGKSVLLKCIIGLLKPETGRVLIHGQNILELSVSRLNTVRKNIGFLFQGAALYDSMTVRENLSFPLKRHFPEMIQNDVDNKVRYTLDLVSLEEAIDKMPSE